MKLVINVLVFFQFNMHWEKKMNWTFTVVMERHSYGGHCGQHHTVIYSSKVVITASYTSRDVWFNPSLTNNYIKTMMMMTMVTTTMMTTTMMMMTMMKMTMMWMVLFLSSTSFPILLIITAASVPTISRCSFNIAYYPNTVCSDHLLIFSSFLHKVGFGHISLWVTWQKTANQ